MSNSPTDVGSKSYYQQVYRNCYVRGGAPWWVVRPESVIGPGRFLGLVVQADDLDTAIEKAIAFFQRERAGFEFVPAPDKDWAEEAGE